MSHDFNVGDRVQYEDEDGEMTAGVITSLFSREEDGDTVFLANVKVDDYDNLVEEFELDYLEHEEDLEDLESEFSKLVKDHMQEIDDQLEIASQALAKAEELSKEYGLPFWAGVSPLGQSYTPYSFYEKFSGLDEDLAEDLTGAYLDGEGAGWEHSQVC